jgi:cell division protein FtsB
MFACIIIVTCQLIKINNLKEKTSALETQKNILVEEIYNYNSANSYHSNNREEYLENYAREMLGWGEKDEIWYTKK